VLALGSGATAALSAVQGGLPALGPAIQDAFGLSLVQVTGVFTAFALGTVLTLLAWGALSDRVGERWVVAVGLPAGAAALATSASADGYPALLATVAVAGTLGSSAIAARGAWCSGGFRATSAGSRSACARPRSPSAPPPRASRFRRWPSGPESTPRCMRWPPRCSLPRSPRRSGCARGPAASPPRPAPDAARDPRIWRLSAASSLMIVGQVGVTSLLVLYLYGERDWWAATAALALGGMQLGAALARVAADRWSDLSGERIEPFRRLAAVAGVLLLAAAALTPAPAAIAVPVLLAGGVAAMSWNGLSFTAAAEISGRRQAGKAMGIQNTAMRVAAAVCR
jgi:predicted MFS family arabinose efflux permease